MQVDSRDRSAETVLKQLFNLLRAGGTLKVGPCPDNHGYKVLSVLPSESGEIESHELGFHLDDDDSVTTLRMGMSWSIEQLGHPPA